MLTIRLLIYLIEEVRRTRAEIIRWACNVRDGLLAKAELADRLAAGGAPQGERP